MTWRASSAAADASQGANDAPTFLTFFFFFFFFFWHFRVSNVFCQRGFSSIFFSSFQSSSLLFCPNILFVFFMTTYQNFYFLSPDIRLLCSSEAMLCGWCNPCKPWTLCSSNDSRGTPHKKGISSLATLLRDASNKICVPWSIGETIKGIVAKPTYSYSYKNMRTINTKRQENSLQTWQWLSALSEPALAWATAWREQVAPFDTLDWLQSQAKRLTPAAATTACRRLCTTPTASAAVCSASVLVDNAKSVALYVQYLFCFSHYSFCFYFWVCFLSLFLSLFFVFSVCGLARAVIERGRGS